MFSKARTLSFLTLLTTIAVGCSNPVAAPTSDPYPNGPKITCPAPPPPATSQNLQAVTVQFGTATTSGGAPGVAVACAPASGASFPVGSTAVVCTATDARQRTDSCSFDVVVQAPTPVITSTSFVAFGDSITWGQDGVPYSSCGTNNNSLGRTMGLVRPMDQVGDPYPSVLASLLAARYTGQQAVIGVANAGNPGERAGVDPSLPPGTSNPALTRFKSVLSTGPAIDPKSNQNAGAFQAVLLMEGSNDIFYSNGSPTAGAQEDAAIAGLRSMVDEAKSRRVRPFLATVPPMVPNSDRSCGSQEVVPLNSKIRALAAQEGITLVDVYAGLGPSDIGPDGLHPNQQGYDDIANIFLQVLRSTLETQPSLTAQSLKKPAMTRPAVRPPAAPAPSAGRRGVRPD